MKILVLGASGMLGFAIHRVLHDSGLVAFGTVRTSKPPASSWCCGLDYFTQIDISDFAAIESVIARNRIEIVINATALKTAGNEQQTMALFRVNSVIPKRLGQLALERDVRLIHFSTDSVYGSTGAPFKETDIPYPGDLYSMSKLLGEPEGRHSLTLRLSLVGRALNGGSNLVDWFLAQTGQVRGYAGVLFSGLPVSEIARVIAKQVLPQLDDLQGVFNLSAAPISKLDLLALIAKEWNLKHIELVCDDSIALDRSIDSIRIAKRIKYTAPAWPQLVHEMRKFYERFEQNGVKNEGDPLQRMSIRASGDDP